MPLSGRQVEAAGWACLDFHFQQLDWQAKLSFEFVFGQNALGKRVEREAPRVALLRPLVCLFACGQPIWSAKRVAAAV